jgi:hypothetical protein
MKIKFPEDYMLCLSLFGEDYTLIFPQNKQYVIMVMMAENKLKEYLIKSFLYNVRNEQDI